MSNLVVIIDDSPTVRATVRVMLERAGYEVQGFPDGPACITWLCSSGRIPNQEEIDIQMPQMDGYCCIRYFRSQPQFLQTPFVILSRYHGMVDRLKGKVLGASTHMAKPFKTAELLSTIEGYLGVPLVQMF